MKQVLRSLAWISVGWVLVMGLGLSHPSTAQTPPEGQKKEVKQPRPVSSPASSGMDNRVAQATIRHIKNAGGKRQPQVTRTKIVGNYAIANWMRGESGGQALLQQTNNDWSVLQSGGGAMNRAVLTGAGVPPDQAEQLLRR
ncbi:MAG TPA: copper uptake system-associated protein [Thermosynechococcaceae cyanobacterium]